ncbi:MAG: hypothetical protein LBS63_00510 [Prevotellaceae bacterium]|jgi:hypothetical protein|nr:hypothetical protein [Prevotellaceae bacterium]
MDTTVLKHPKAAHAAGSSARQPGRRAPWEVTAQEMVADAELAAKDYAAGLCITHADFLKEVATGKSGGRPLR